MLFNPDTDALLGINGTGLAIWRALARPFSHDGLVAHVLATFEGAPRDQVAGDVEAFLGALQPRGFVGRVLESMLADAGQAADARAPEPEAAPGAPRSPVVEVTDEGCSRFYRGRSMLGTFRPGDCLTVEPVPLAAIGLGDVVLYRGGGPPEAQGEVVHRVVGLLPGGLVTRGDNNPRSDAAPVTADRLLGRVTRLERGPRVHRVRGGYGGLLGLQGRRTRQAILRAAEGLLRAMGRPPYRWLREQDLARHLWRPALVCVVVETNRGSLVKIAHRGRTVARWWPARKRFECQKPYDLILSRPG